MEIQETFPSPSYLSYQLTHWGGSLRSSNNKDNEAIGWMGALSGCMDRCEQSGIAYARGSWGYTVLRTTYSDESDALWPIAMEKLRRWVTQYFIHLNRLAMNKSDGSINEELGRRFIVEVFEDADSEKLKFPDLANASQDDIKSLTDVFDAWLRNAVGNVEVDPVDSPRFSDFLIIDEGSLRSLAALPDETPPLGLVTRDERRARIGLYEEAYVWLVDSQAVRRFQGVEDGDNYNGWMKLFSSDITDAWFERATWYEGDNYIFERRKIERRVIREESGNVLWYSPR